MKKLILAVILFAVSAPSQATTTFELCIIARDAARATMDMRQRGDAKHEVMAMTSSESIHRMINDAYHTPIFDSDFLRERTIDRFGLEYFDQCLDENY